jgi:8-oxo-dGTP pyrophosphatase MutT (NUDIX family)
VSERRTVHRHSAGGVLYRRKSGRIDVCIIQPRGTVRWQLPKGWIEEGEDPEAAAVREVAEETGCRGTVENLLDEIDYWFYGDERGEKVRIHKNVTFFLLRYEEGDPSGADPYEVADVRWIPAPAALVKIEFANERRVLQKALERLAPDSGAGQTSPAGGSASGGRHRAGSEAAHGSSLDDEHA